jgi:hypothetical protein
MRFAKIVFWCGGAWGFLVLTPLYFTFDLVGRQNPPAITHPDFYFGFVGVALAWQAAFLVIATDPARFRPLMLPSALEKFAYAGALFVLRLQGRLSATQLPFGAADLLLGLLFLAAFFQTKPVSK